MYKNHMRYGGGVSRNQPPTFLSLIGQELNCLENCLDLPRFRRMLTPRINGKQPPGKEEIAKQGWNHGGTPGERGLGRD